MALINEQTSGPGGNGPKRSIERELRPLVKTPAEDFAVTLMDIADSFDALDTAFTGEDVDDSFGAIEDGQEGFNPSGPEIELLAGKWKAIPRAERRAIESEMVKENPQFAKVFIAVMESVR